jgi:hypothetical protein
VCYEKGTAGAQDFAGSARFDCVYRGTGKELTDE